MYLHGSGQNLPLDIFLVYGKVGCFAVYASLHRGVAMYPRSDTPHGWECPDSIICKRKYAPALWAVNSKLYRRILVKILPWMESRFSRIRSGFLNLLPGDHLGMVYRRDKRYPANDISQQRRQKIADCIRSPAFRANRHQK